MAGRFTKRIPEFIYFIDGGEWKRGIKVQNR